MAMASCASHLFLKKNYVPRILARGESSQIHRPRAMHGRRFDCGSWKELTRFFTMGKNNHAWRGREGRTMMRSKFIRADEHGSIK
jgi:hypothetical protein